MPSGIWDVSLADKIQDPQKNCLLQWHCLGGRSLDTSPGPRWVWLVLSAEKENEWHFQTSQVSTPPFTVAAAAARNHTRVQGKELSKLCPAVTSCAGCPCQAEGPSQGKFCRFHQLQALLQSSHCGHQVLQFILPAFWALLRELTGCFAFTQLSEK